MILPSSAIFHLEEGGLVKALKIEEPEMRRKVLMATNRSASLSDANLKMREVIRRITAVEQELGHWRGVMKSRQLNTACA